MANKYSFQKFEEKTMVRVSGRNLPISKKTSREVCHFIKGKDVNKIIGYLKEVEKLKLPIPFLRFRHDVPHRKGNIGPGRFPKKSASHILDLLNTLKSNANDKGLNSEGLLLVYANVSPGPRLMHYGRHRSSVRKMCNIELIAKEVIKSKPKSKKKKNILSKPKKEEISTDSKKDYKAKQKKEMNKSNSKDSSVEESINKEVNDQK